MLATYSFAIWGLWLILTTVFVQAIVASAAHRKQTHYVPGIVDEKLSHESFVFRSHRTFLNSHENLLMMFGPAVVGNADWYGCLLAGCAGVGVCHCAYFAHGFVLRHGH